MGLRFTENNFLKLHISRFSSYVKLSQENPSHTVDHPVNPEQPYRNFLHQTNIGPIIIVNFLQLAS